MVDWQSQEEVIKNGVAFDRFMHALLGLYIWEWFTSLHFEWEFISGKKKFHWPMLFYFLNRYFLLVALIGIVVALNVTSKINCQAIYTFNQCLGNAATGLASINLSLRTMAVWNQNKYLVGFLILVILGHWPLLLHGSLLTAVWVPGSGCVISDTNNRILAISFIYSMVFDFTVFCLTAFKLLSPGFGCSPLVKLIFHDGLIYFLIAFLVNLLAAVFMLLNLNALMSIIANVPATIASTIVACKVIRRLNQFSPEGPEVTPSGGTQISTLAFVRPKAVTMAEGIHVQVETYHEGPMDSKKSPYLMEESV